MTEKPEENRQAVSSKPERNPDGTFAKGNITSRLGGRPRKTDVQRMLDSIAKSSAVQNAGELIEEVIEMARQQKSGRTILRAIELAADRIDGKPVQRTADVSDGYEALAALMAGDDDGDEGNS